MKQLNEERVVLASQSPRRQELLHSLGVRFYTCPAQIDEGRWPTLPPAQLVEKLALMKAAHVAKQLQQGELSLPEAAIVGAEESASNTIVIGSDTVVVLAGEVLGKPRDEAEACRMLQRLAGETHQVFTGLALIRFQGKKEEAWVQQVGHRSTRVKMSQLHSAEIARYVASGEPMDKAGAYAIQGKGATLIEGIEGDYFTVVGLPLQLLAQFLKAWGYVLF